MIIISFLLPTFLLAKIRVNAVYQSFKKKKKNAAAIHIMKTCDKEQPMSNTSLTRYEIINLNSDFYCDYFGSYGVERKDDLVKDL